MSALSFSITCFIDCIDNVYDWSRQYFDFAWKSRIIHKTRESTTNHNTQISFPCMDVFKLKWKCNYHFTFTFWVFLHSPIYQIYKNVVFFLSNICVRHIDATLTVDYVTANKEQRAKSDKGPCISVVSVIGFKTPGHDHKFNSYLIQYAQSWIRWQWCWSHRRRYMESLQQSKWTGLQVQVTAVCI